jgi:NitT/TauT family transport system permease protein
MDRQLQGPKPRREIFNTVERSTFGVVAKPLTMWERAFDNGALRKAVLLALLALLWEGYARYLDDALLFPTFTSTVEAFFQNILNGVIPKRAWSSLQVLLQGYAIGLFLAACLTALASAGRIGSDLLETLTAMFNPLPSIALLPLALIWFGLGSASIVFVLVHSVLWAVALNTHTGFQSVSQTLRMVGNNYGLNPLAYVCKILIPAASPHIVTGLKIGWAFAWRTLIAAELVFGVTSGSGGLGWFIYENKNLLEIPNVFAGLLTVILIGLIVENLVFKTLEKHTVRKWGLQS